MKTRGKILSLVCGLFLVFSMGILAGNSNSKAAEVPIAPSSSMTSAPQLELGTTYYATMNNYSGYVSFVTPAEGGYVTVYYKNISISGWADAYVKSGTGEVLASSDRSPGYALSWEFQSEPGKRNEAELEPNTRYYLQVGESEKSGNVLFSVSFTADGNPNGKDQAEEISLNSTYTRSIDSDIQTDYDYFKFTTGKAGGHRLTISRSKTDGWFDWQIRKWATDELAKKSGGGDASDDFGGSSMEEDLALDANTTYYLKVWHDVKMTYTFSINNQSVSSISIPSSKTLAAGESFMLNPTVLPDSAYNKSVKYSSSNSDIAWVNSDGKVTASGSKCGTSVITVAAQDGSGVTATCKVTVVPAAPSTPYVASYSSKSHTIKWSSQSGASAYVVYVKSGKTWKAIKTTTGTSFKRTGLKSGQKCQYRIRSYISSAGNHYSAYSGICYAATAPGSTPKRVKAKRTKKKTNYYSSSRYYATISWSKVKKATGYQIYYRQAGSSSQYSYGTTNKRTLKVNLYRSKYSTSSRTYYFTVKPYFKYHGTTYYGKMSKAKKYKFH